MSAATFKTVAIFGVLAFTAWSRGDGQQANRRFPGMPWGIGSRTIFHPESSELYLLLTGLVNLENVQEDLKVTPEQAVSLKELQKEARAKRVDRNIAEIAKLPTEEQRKLNREWVQQRPALTAEFCQKIDAVLLPEQRTRLKQIVVQLRGIEVLDDREVIQELTLSEEQVQQLTNIAQGSRDAFSRVGGADDARERIARRDAARKEMSAQMLAVLTPEQKARYDALQGTRIEIDVSRLTRATFTARPAPQPQKD